MKMILKYTILIIILLAALQASCQYVSMEEAAVVAGKWIEIVKDKSGGWGSSETAIALPMQELKNKDRLIGYYCNVNPSGYIVVSLRKELEPVKASSEECTFDPSKEGGMVALIKSKMTGMIGAIESKFGSIETADHNDVEGLCQVKYASQWEEITGYVPGTYSKETKSTDSYTPGSALLTVEWDQGPPYNNLCPYLGCSQTSNGNAPVGCVATAGAQLMRYWAYPPWHYGGSTWYDWENMPDDVWTTSPQAQQDAVALLSRNIGIFVGMSYACDGSSAHTYDMANVYGSYWYDIPAILYRDWFVDPQDWWTQIVSFINMEKPIHYRVEGHSIVCDGWRTMPTQQYHMNYGWDDSHTTWYTLDALLYGGFDEEYMLLGVSPSVSLGSSLSGVYTKNSTFPWRYFNLDASGSNAQFNSGQYIQFLEGKTVKGTGTGNGVSFWGGSGGTSYLFSDGKYSDGISITSGTIRLKNNGMIYVH